MAQDSNNESILNNTQDASSQSWFPTIQTNDNSSLFYPNSSPTTTTTATIIPALIFPNYSLTHTSKDDNVEDQLTDKTKNKEKAKCSKESEEKGSKIHKKGSKFVKRGKSGSMVSICSNPDIETVEEIHAVPPTLHSPNGPPPQSPPSLGPDRGGFSGGLTRILKWTSRFGSGSLKDGTVLTGKEETEEEEQTTTHQQREVSGSFSSDHEESSVNNSPASLLFSMYAPSSNSYHEPSPLNPFPPMSSRTQSASGAYLTMEQLRFLQELNYSHETFGREGGREMERDLEGNRFKILKKPDASSNVNTSPAGTSSSTRPSTPGDSQQVPNRSQIIKLNIGGLKYQTTVGTLTETGDNYFSSILSGLFQITLDEEGYYFIDRDGEYFKPILDYLRTGELFIPDYMPGHCVYREARYYCVPLPRTSIPSRRVRPLRRTGVYITQERHIQERSIILFKDSKHAIMSNHMGTVQTECTVTEDAFVTMSTGTNNITFAVLQDALVEIGALTKYLFLPARLPSVGTMFRTLKPVGGGFCMLKFLDNNRVAFVVTRSGGVVWVQRVAEYKQLTDEKEEEEQLIHLVVSDPNLPYHMVPFGDAMLLELNPHAFVVHVNLCSLVG
eukprot:TRINITY_DN2959_c0_g1_i2.p1 TRINITY_DN2959_c0_g1~~TRINITY_DN2959_c0_g1_i2.p1  ORF type:complete len:614 (+),score=149.84 TRINITY_DN2959_c0_g1_i2:42-1883(+)